MCQAECKPFRQSVWFWPKAAHSTHTQKTIRRTSLSFSLSRSLSLFHSPQNFVFLQRQTTSNVHPLWRAPQKVKHFSTWNYTLMSFIRKFFFRVKMSIKNGIPFWVVVFFYIHILSLICRMNTMRWNAKFLLWHLSWHMSQVTIQQTETHRTRFLPNEWQVCGGGIKQKST